MNCFKMRARHFLNVAGTLGVFALVSPNVLAQDSVPGSGSKAGLEEVVVTGSLIKRRTDAPLSSPAEVLSREEMGMTPRATIADFIIELPINSGSFNSQEQTAASDSSAVGFNLRGLGPRNTLVLINGRRQVASPQPDKQNFNKVDINSLMPSIMLERVEVLKDGAASLYGSDAIAGVANFLTRDTFEGFEMSVDWVKTENGGKDDLNFQGLWGQQSESGGVVAAFGYQTRDPAFIDDLFSPERFARFETLSGFGTPSTFRLGGTPGGQIVVDPLCGDPRLDEAADAISPADINRPVSINDGNRCRKPFAVGRGFNADETRFQGMLRAFYDVNENMRTHLEVGVSRTELERFNQTLPTAFPQASVSDALVPASNPGNPFGQNVLWTFGRIGLNGQPFRNVGAEQGLEVEDTVIRVNSGFELNMLKDRMNLGFDITYSRADEDLTDSDVVRGNIGLALRGLGGINCNPSTGTPGVGDCLFFNPFGNAFLAQPGDPEFNTPEVLEFIQPAGNITKDGRSELLTIEAIVSGKLFNLPGGPLGAAVGYQYRDEEWSLQKSPASNNGTLVFEGVNPDAAGTRDVYAVFYEFVAPVMDNVEVSVSGRFEDFGSGINSFDPKFGILVEPMENLVLRASYSTGFQVAGLNALNSTEVAVESIVANNEVNSVNVTIIGDPNLQPQESDNISIGAEYTWGGFDAAVDFWDIKFTDIIGTLNPQAFFDANKDNPDLVTLDSIGTPLRMNLLVQNLSSIDSNGIDFNLDYTRDLGKWGLLEIDTSTSYLNRYLIQQVPGGPAFDGAGRRQADSNFAGPMPEWRGNYRATLSFGPNRAYRASLRARYVGNIDDVDRPVTPDEAFTPIDLIFSASLNNLLGATGYTSRDTVTNLQFGINNVFDEGPPGIFNSDLTFEPRIFNGLGRQFSLSFTHSFR